MQSGMPIGKAADASGVKVPTIRYYENIGLLPAPPRNEGNRRLYEREDVRRLAFIRHARELGFGIEEIRDLLKLSDNPETSCAAADTIARAHLEQVELKLSKLKALKKELKRMVEECGHGHVSQCRVIEVLSDHRHCVGSH